MKKLLLVAIIFCFGLTGVNASQPTNWLIANVPIDWDIGVLDNYGIIFDTSLTDNFNRTVWEFEFTNSFINLWQSLNYWVNNPFTISILSKVPTRATDTAIIYSNVWPSTIWWMKLTKTSTDRYMIYIYESASNKYVRFISTNSYNNNWHTISWSYNWWWLIAPTGTGTGSVLLWNFKLYVDWVEDLMTVSAATMLYGSQNFTSAQNLSIWKSTNDSSTHYTIWKVANFAYYNRVIDPQEQTDIHLYNTTPLVIPSNWDLVVNIFNIVWSWTTNTGTGIANGPSWDFIYIWLWVAFLLAIAWLVALFISYLKR